MRQAEYNRLDFGTALEFKPLILGVIAANPEGKVITVTFNICKFFWFNSNRFVFAYSYDINTSKNPRCA
jgi:hypothetical protein